MIAGRYHPEFADSCGMIGWLFARMQAEIRRKAVL